LALLRVVRTEWKDIELKLMATARQLAHTDQLVPLAPLVTFFGQGYCSCLAKIGSWLVLRARLESRQAAVSAGITVWLELNTVASVSATFSATGPHNLASAGADADPSLPGGGCGSGGSSSDWKEMEIPFPVLVAMAKTTCTAN